MPVTLNIVTGLLGSGKTAAVQHLLLDSMPIEKPAVVVGEFAEEGLDKELYEPSNVPIHQLTGTREGAQEKSYIAPIKELVLSNRHNRIYLETSGVTEIHRIVADLLNDDELLRRIVFGRTITVIDAGGFDLHDKHFNDQLWSQINAADVIVINKVDRADRAQLDHIAACVKERNSTARVVRAYMGQFHRSEVNSPPPEDFTPRILTDAIGESQVREFESFIYRTNETCYDRVMFGHILLNLPDARIARFKGKLKSYDKTYCVNGFPGQLDWDNTPVSGDTSIAFIGLNLLEHQDRILTRLDEELERQWQELVS